MLLPDFCNSELDFCYENSYLWIIIIDSLKTDLGIKE